MCVSLWMRYKREREREKNVTKKENAKKKRNIRATHRENREGIIRGWSTYTRKRSFKRKKS